MVSSNAIKFHLFNWKLRTVIIENCSNLSTPHCTDASRSVLSFITASGCAYEYASCLGCPNRLILDTPFPPMHASLHGSSQWLVRLLCLAEQLLSSTCLDTHYVLCLLLPFFVYGLAGWLAGWLAERLDLRIRPPKFSALLFSLSVSLSTYRF